jgi:hypothetical protein
LKSVAQRAGFISGKRGYVWILKYFTASGFSVVVMVMALSTAVAMAVAMVMVSVVGFSLWFLNILPLRDVVVFVVVVAVIVICIIVSAT